MGQPSIGARANFLSTHDLKKSAAYYKTVCKFLFVLHQGTCCISRICQNGSACLNPNNNTYRLFVRDASEYLIKVQHFLSPARPKPIPE